MGPLLPAESPTTGGEQSVLGVVILSVPAILVYACNSAKCLKI